MRISISFFEYISTRVTSYHEHLEHKLYSMALYYIIVVRIERPLAFEYMLTWSCQQNPSGPYPEFAKLKHVGGNQNGHSGYDTAGKHVLRCPGCDGWSMTGGLPFLSAAFRVYAPWRSYRIVTGGNIRRRGGLNDRCRRHWSRNRTAFRMGRLAWRRLLSCRSDGSGAGSCSPRSNLG